MGQPASPQSLLGAGSGFRFMPRDLTMTDARMKTATGAFLRHVSHTAQREIEKALRRALEKGTIKPNQDVPAAITLHSEALDLEVTIHSRIEL
jgi:hypothetical protein